MKTLISPEKAVQMQCYIVASLLGSDMKVDFKKHDAGSVVSTIVTATKNIFEEICEINNVEVGNKKVLSFQEFESLFWKNSLLRMGSFGVSSTVLYEKLVEIGAVKPANYAEHRNGES